MGFMENVKKYCEDNRDYSAFWTKFDASIHSLKDRLGGIPLYFRHFSRHDSSHSVAIIRYLETLIGEEAITKLSISDQAFIILAAYSHDIGMSLEHKQIKEYFNNSNFAEDLKNRIPSGYKDLDDIVDEILRFPESVKDCDSSDVYKLYSDVSVAIENIFRAGHARRSAEQIKGDATIVNALGIRGAKLLSKICSLHDGSIDQIMNLPFEENGFFSDYIHPRFVAGMLCLGDLLDLDTDRFDEIVLRASSNMPALSQLHKEKHESITHFLVKDGRIELCADSDNHKVYRILNEWVSWIKVACEFLVVSWDEITPDKSILPPRLKQCDITIDGNREWLKYADSKIHIDASKAVKIFEGSNIYKGKFTFIRELIQNAIDATLIQLYDDATCIKKISGEDAQVSAEFILDCFNSCKTENDSDDNEESAKNNLHPHLNISDYDIRGRFYEAKKKESIKNSDLKYLFDDLLNDDSFIIFELEDRGTGIKKTEIDSILGLKGKSKDLKKKISEIPAFFRPSGIFGIGIQSVFQVASKIVYITKSEEEKAKVITINDPSQKGDVYIEEYEGIMHRGTRVLVLMDPDKFSQTDLGRADYVYKTIPKQKLILTWLFQHIYNMEKNPAPGFESERQTTDYFNTLIRGYLGDESSERDVLKRTSIIPDIAQNYNKNKEIRIQNGKLKYTNYDLNNNCIFDAVIMAGCDRKTLENKDGVIRLGCCNDWLLEEYYHNVFYRNVLANSNMGSDSWEKYCVEGKYIDYKINLLSDNADEVLNIGRNAINNEYRSKLRRLINHELSIMFKKIIDYCIENKNEVQTKHLRIVFLAYIESQVYQYKQELFYKEFKAVIDKMELNNYYSLEDKNDEKSIPLNRLFNSKIYFLKEIGDDEVKKIPEFVWNDDNSCKKNIDSNMYCFKYHVDKPGRHDRHILTHILEGEYYTIINGKKYLVYQTVPYVRGKEYGSSFRGEFLRYKEFLYVVLNDLRCVLATEGYTDLETPTAEGIVDSYNNDMHRAVEIMLDDAIKMKLRSILINKGCVPDASKIISEIERTEVYKANIGFIIDYHRHLNDNVEADVIKNKYKEFLTGLLKLLEKDNYATYLSEYYNDYTKDLTWGSLNDVQFDYFSWYVIDRFPAEIVERDEKYF